VLTEEQKERLRIQLAKGRATSLANRKKKAQMKKIEKEEKINAQEEELLEKLKKKKAKSQDKDDLLKQIEELKEKLEQATMPSTRTEGAKPKKPTKSKKTPAPEENFRLIKKEKKAPVKAHVPAPKAPTEPKPPQTKPPAPKAPVLSNRRKLKMMRGL